MSTDSHLTLGKYKLVNCLASGQHSQIWEAIDNETTRRVAIKMLLPEALAEDDEQLTFLKNEFKIGKSLEHPNFLKYHELVVKGGFISKQKSAYFSMDLFNAPNLKAWLHNDLLGIHIRFKRLVELVAMALEHMHDKGWVHRDIKPDNILMNKSTEVRLIDFSLTCRAASVMSKVFSRKQSMVKGTRTYMAPEQIMGKALTPQTDIYGLGVTLFEILTGQAPFAGSTPKDLLLRHMNDRPPDPSTINTNISPQMDMILQRMLSKKPEQRQKKISEFLVEFRNATVFKEAVVERPEPTDREKAEAQLSNVIGNALDSRADALRTQLGVAAPASPRKKQQKPRPAAQNPPAAPAPPQMPPGMMPMQPMLPPGQFPMQPYPMQPMPMQPMPMPMPGAPLPGMLMPGAPMPGGPSPWVSVPAAAGQPGPWMSQPAPVAAPGAPMTPPPAVARPAPPPVAPTAVPQVTPRPAPVAPPQPAAKKPAPIKPPAKQPSTSPGLPPEGMKIDDLLGFNDLPPV